MGGTPKSSILIGFSIANHPFWGTPVYGNPRICVSYVSLLKLDFLWVVKTCSNDEPEHICHWYPSVL